jgi:RNA polymerase primary sigma factor
LATALGYEPSDEEIAQETGISLDEVMKIRQGAHVTTSLDKPIGDEGDATIGDVLDVKGAVIEEEVEDKLEHETLQKAIDELPEAERIVIEMRFEIDGNETTSLRLVGRKLNVSTERARQIQKRALKRLAQNEELIALKDAEK